jgi:hypothetical protein
MTNAHLERFMTVSNIVEPMYLRFVREQGSTDRVYRRISPPFVVETALFVQVIEELGVRCGPPEIQISDFEV